MKCCLLSVDVPAAQRLFDSLEAEKLADWTWIKNKSDLFNIDNFDYVFVFRWPFIIKNELLQSCNFVGFHTSNLPHGRGGSPLQNQIMEGIIESRVNAIKLNDGIDEGPIYASSSITLQGTVEDIWYSISFIAEKLIKKIILERPEPIKQIIGNEIVYKRRKNNCIEDTKIDSIQDLHRFIQMLDGVDYPRAYIETENFRIEFDRSSLRSNSILCDAKITRKVKS